MVDQSLSPTYQAKSTKYLWLDLYGDVEILRVVRVAPANHEGIQPEQLNKLRMEQHL